MVQTKTSGVLTSRICNRMHFDISLCFFLQPSTSTIYYYTAIASRSNVFRFLFSLWAESLRFLKELLWLKHDKAPNIRFYFCNHVYCDYMVGCARVCVTTRYTFVDTINAVCDVCEMNMCVSVATASRKRKFC